MTDPEICNWPDYILKKLMDDVSDVKTDLSSLKTDVKAALAGIEVHVGAMVEAVKLDRERCEKEITRLKERLDDQEDLISNLKTDVRVLAGRWAAAISIVVFVLQIVIEHVIGLHP
jgi:predicted  nucleic acid-binding Zn-ribbon protein